MINPEQLDFLERDIQAELKDTKKWVSRLQKRIYKMELVQELLMEKKASQKKIVHVQQDIFSKEA